ncbi:MAG: hypothetical protein GY849_17535 [Deltaproteobacteria bacterium]|nr:hypothetical protein [Deltaproteobacteria bacterium]
MLPKNLKEMKNYRAVLFPHTYLPGPFVNRIRPVFGSLSICQPWFMDAPFPETEGGAPSSIHIIRPPDTLKPKQDFKILLSEYRTWMRYHQDDAATGNQAAGHDTYLSEERAWDIRRLILGRENDERAAAENNALKWHLILHLARELEETRADAEDMLSQVMQKESPLMGALEEETPMKGMLEDLPPSGTDAFLDASHLHLVCEAWFGLFGQHLQDQEVLLTLDQSVMAYAAEICEDESTGVAEPLVSGDNLTAQRLPGPFNNKKLEGDPVKAGLYGKMIVLLRAE